MSVAGGGAGTLPKSNAAAVIWSGLTALFSTTFTATGAEKMKPRESGSIANPTLSCAQIAASGLSRIPTYCSYVRLLKGTGRSVEGAL